MSLYFHGNQAIEPSLLFWKSKFDSVSFWKTTEIELILKMLPPNTQYPAYSSLNNSIVLSPNHNHTRTHSNTRPQTPLTFQHQYTRVPSQKKLTLTSQNQVPLPKLLQKEPELTLKKRGGECTYNKGKFVSLQNSRIDEPQPLSTKRENEPDYLTELKRVFRDKIRQLQSAYSHNLKEYSNQVRELQIKLLSNSRQLQCKQKKIKELEAVVSQYKCQKPNNKSEENYSFMDKKTSDLETKIRIITSYTESICQNEGKESDRIEVLSQQVINHFGSHLRRLKQKTQFILNNCFSRISQQENQLEFLKNHQEKVSEGTRGSTVSMCSSDCPNFNYPKSHQNMSFFDDTFFIPNQHSQDFEFVLEMAQRRSQPLSCWVDHEGFLRYADTNSYLFNRRGDRISLQKEQIDQLVLQKMLVFS